MAEVEEKFTTAAPSPSRSAGTDSRIIRNVPVRLIRITCSKESRLVSRVCEERRM